MAGNNVTRVEEYFEKDKLSPRELLNLDGKNYYVTKDGKIRTLNPSGKIIITDKDGNIIGEVDPSKGGIVQFPDTSTMMEDSGAEEGTYGPLANATPLHGDKINIPKITVNSKGIITKITNKVITLPSVLTHMKVEIKKDSISSATPDYDGSFTTVDSVERDENGHVLKINTKTVNFPHAIYNVVIPIDGWDGNNAPYIKTIAVNGIKESDTPIIDVSPSHESYYLDHEQIESFIMIYSISTNNNSITIRTNAKPRVVIPIQIKI